MTTSRPNLANEIWLMIIGLVPRKDLPSLSLVSKRLHDLTECVLYSEIDAKENKHHHPSLVLFLRTILEQPWFASHVKHLQLRVADKASYEDDSSTLRIDCLTYTNRFSAKKCVRQSTLSKDIQDRWHESIFDDEENWDAIAAFVIFLVSDSLQSLTMENYGAWNEYSFIGHLLDEHKTSKKSCLLSRLRSVNLYDCDAIVGWRCLSLSTAMPYLRLPSITNFASHGFMGFQHTPLPAKLEANSSITSLSLMDCELSGSTLKSFLESFTALKSLDWSGSNTHCDMRGVLSTLSELKTHLESLTVDEWKVRERVILSPGTLTLSLTDFTALKTFTVDSRSALGSLELPVLCIDSHAMSVPRFDSLDQALFTPERQTLTISPDKRALAMEWFKIIEDEHLCRHSEDRVSAFRDGLPDCIESL